MSLKSPGEEIAQLAARFLVQNRAAGYGEALKLAVQSMKDRPSSLPSRSMIRRHVQAMRLSELGTHGVRQRNLHFLSTAEEIMTLLDEQFSPNDILIAGRAARGRFDEPPCVHLRIYSRSGIGEIAAILVDAGFEEPRFETAATRHGRADRIRFQDAGCEFVLTRCPPEWHSTCHLDLHTGKQISIATIDSLRRLLSQDRP